MITDPLNPKIVVMEQNGWLNHRMKKTQRRVEMTRQDVTEGKESSDNPAVQFPASVTCRTLRTRTREGWGVWREVAPMGR
ncbi:hypothetical protein J6590_057151 [Homalodisca vitripennis]|nr:hypothetical protein J6590_057151 [Homalodisca vitripennis]